MKREKIKSENIYLNLELYESESPHSVVIFLPGTGCPVSLYSSFLEKMAKAGFTVAGMDYRGHGLSEGRRGDFTVDEIMEDIRNVRDYLSERYHRRMGIMGSSQGGILCLYALHDVEGFSFGICHNAVYLYELENYLPWYLRGGPFIFKWFLKMGSILFPTVRIRTFYVNWRYVFEDRRRLKEVFHHPLFVKRYSFRTLHSLFNYVPRHNTPTAPFLILVGEKEKVVPNIFARRVKEKFPHLCDLKEIKGAEHMLLLEHPEETMAEIEKWFSHCY